MTEATQAIFPVTPEDKWQAAWDALPDGMHAYERARQAGINALGQSHSLPGERMREALERIATVDMGGGFLSAQACRKIASDALSRQSYPVAQDAGTARESDKPPAHWTPDVMSSRGIETAEEWDWRRDGPENDPLNRSWNRLRFAYVYADPHAPDQMALVLRIDLGRILSRLTRALAQIEMKDEQIAALTPSPCPGDGMRREIIFRELRGSMPDGSASRIADAIIAALTPSALSPEPVQKVHELPEGHRWCRHCEQKDPHCSVCEGVGYLPSALSGDAGEAMSKRTFLTCVSGDGPTPYLKVHFNNLADAHSAHDELLGRKGQG